MKKRNNILKTLCVLFLLLACSEKTAQVNRRPIVHLLIQNSGFEQQGSWSISAPPNYNYYGQIKTDETFCRSGRRCGLIRLQRLPGKKGELVIHAFTQQMQHVPGGKTVIFGGWAAASPGTRVRIAIEYETAVAHSGQTIFNEKLEWSADRSDYHFLSKRLTFPDDAIRAYFIAGIASAGEVRFDNLFVFVDSQIRPEPENITNK